MSRITQIFYGNDCLPYKDSARTVHYPITGCSFAGSSNVNELHFYVRDIGGVNNLSWVANVKLPNGKILYQLLTDIHLDSEINEYYVTFNLSSFYTQLKGDIYISLNGCLGEVEITVDPETNIATINGEIDSNTVVATGAVKFTINYAPQRPTGFSFELDQYQTIIDALSGKSNIVNTIQIIPDVELEDLSGYDDGQLLFDLSRKTYYKKITDDEQPTYEIVENGAGILASEKTLVRTYFQNFGYISDMVGTNKLVIINFIGQDYLVKIGNTFQPTFDVCALNLLTREFYYSDSMTTSNTLNHLVRAENRITYVELKTDINSVYATNGSGEQVMIPYGTLAVAGMLVRRVSNGQVIVPETPTDNLHSTSKKYVDDNDTYLKNYIDGLIETIKKNSFILVDTSVYPTLQSFLASTGQEGFIYLYPSTNQEQGYFQYIWEDNSWLDIGTTQIDLSDYYTKSQTNTLLNTKLDKRTTSGLRAYTHNGSTQNDVVVSNDNNSNSIPLRDVNGNIQVGTPSNSSDATPKTYVDTLGLNLDNAKVDKTNSGEKVYGTDELGAQTTYDVDSDLVGSGAIVRRETSTGTVVVGTPTSNTHATTKSYVDNAIASAISTVYKIKGSKTVAEINALTGMQVGDVYNMLDSGDIVLGDLQVFTGDNIVWTGSAWDKLGAEIDWHAYDEKFIAAGFFEVQPYNEDTGEITLVYATDLYIASYDTDTGIMTIEAN